MAGAAATAQFDILTGSVNSNNTERDYKISDSFFGTMVNTATISGKVLSLNDDGSGAISLTMNGVEKEIASGLESNIGKPFKAVCRYRR